MPKVIILEGPTRGQVFDLSGSSAFVGRSSRNDIKIEDNAMSRKHIKIFRIGKKYFLEDLKSTNGTRLNGKAIAPGEGFEISEEDVISIGNTVFRLSEIPVTYPKGNKDFVTSETAKNREHIDTGSRERRSGRPKHLDLIYRVSELLKDSLGIREFFDSVLEGLLNALPRIDKVAILLFDEQKKQIKDVFSKGRENSVEKTLGYCRGVVEWVFENRKAIRMSDTSREPRHDFSDSISALKIGSLMCVPMISNAEMFGAIYIDAVEKPYGFRKDDLQLLHGLSGPTAIAVEKDMLATRLRAVLSE
ncbi:MAG: FHA domain-containing protein [Desulfatiglans sp.]|nr:FHA domain-containing protein [Thermodesulfobacteriota bacterium]MEE4353148.1 FHA domain-containing protein [Desulfatiglans sp.]